jgi:3-oxoacyl-[acyl-carrier protein] reductase
MVERLLSDGFKVENWDLKDGAPVAGSSAQDYRFRALDVSNPEQVQEASKSLIADWGLPHALVNNAGITRDSMLNKMSLETFSATWKVNVQGTFLPTQILGSAMRDRAAELQKQGKATEVEARRIVMISSVAGIFGNVGQANYAASKAAVVGFMKSVAKEWGRYGISAVAVAPGFMRTEMTETVPAEIRQNFIDRTPLRRMGEPNELANFICYLCRPESSFLTGEVINFSGGLLL